MLLSVHGHPRLPATNARGGGEIVTARANLNRLLSSELLDIALRKEDQLKSLSDKVGNMPDYDCENYNEPRFING